jgi:hypothetical protein
MGGDNRSPCHLLKQALAPKLVGNLQTAGEMQKNEALI